MYGEPEQARRGARLCVVFQLARRGGALCRYARLDNRNARQRGSALQKFDVYAEGGDRRIFLRRNFEKFVFTDSFALHNSRLGNDVSLPEKRRRFPFQDRKIHGDCACVPAYGNGGEGAYVFQQRNGAIRAFRARSFGVCRRRALAVGGGAGVLFALGLSGHHACVRSLSARRRKRVP